MKKTIFFIMFLLYSVFAISSIVDITTNNDKIIFGRKNSVIVQEDGKIFVTYGKRTDEQKFSLYFAFSENGNDNFTETYIDTLYNYPFIKEKTAPVIFVSDNKIIIYYTKSRNPSSFELWKAISTDNGSTFQKQFTEDNIFLPVDLTFDGENQFLSYIKGKKKIITNYLYYTKYEQTENLTLLPFFNDGNENSGMTHSNDDIFISNTENTAPTFHSLVTTSGQIVSNGNYYSLNQIFQNGYLENVPEENYILPQDFDPDMPFDNLDANIIYVNIQGNHYTSKLGRIQVVGVENIPVYSWYPQNAEQAEEAIENGYNWLSPENIIYVNQVTLFDTVWTDGPSGDIENNSIIFTQKTLWIKGSIAEKQIWGSSENIYIVGDITYQNTEPGQAPDNPDNINQNDYFALISMKKIIIKYKFIDPMNNFATNSDNCDGINLYGAYCALQEADPNIYGDFVSHYDGVLTFEYQHPHGSTPDFMAPSPFTGNDTLYTYVDLHKFIYPPDNSLPSELLPYNIHGGDPVSPYDMCGYPYEADNYQPNSNVPPYGADYPWYNPVWPESAEYIVTERGTINLFGGVYQVRKGFLHRSGNDSYNHPDNSWMLDNQTFNYGGYHPSTGYGKNYHFDKRFLINPFLDMPLSFVNIPHQNIIIKLSTDNGETFQELLNEEVPISLLRKKLFKLDDGFLFAVQGSSSELFLVSITENGIIQDIVGLDFSELSNSVVVKNLFLYQNTLYILADDFTNEYLIYHQLGEEGYVLLNNFEKPLISDYILVGNEDLFAYYIKSNGEEINVYAFESPLINQMTEKQPIDIDFEINAKSKLSSFVFDNIGNFVICTNNPTGETSYIKLVKSTLQDASSDNYSVTASPVTFKSYPNPFKLSSHSQKSQFTISFYLPKSENMKISIYNIKGQLVKKLTDKKIPAGNHKILWKGIDSKEKKVKSGIYFYRIERANAEIVKKFVLIN